MQAAEAVVLCYNRRDQASYCNLVNLLEEEECAHGL